MQIRKGGYGYEVYKRKQKGSKMKNALSRVISILVMSITLCTIISSGSIKSYAEIGTSQFTVMSESYKFDSSFPEPFKNRGYHFAHITMSGKSSYCIQFGEAIYNGLPYNNKTTYDSLSSSQRELVNRTLIFGFNDVKGPSYGGTWWEEYMATQALVWIIVTNQYNQEVEAKIVNELLNGSPNARAIYEKIKGDVATFSKIPSYTTKAPDQAPVYTLKYNNGTKNYTIEIKDAYTVHEEFLYTLPVGSYQLSGDKIVITIPLENKLEKSLTIVGEKQLPKNQATPLIDGNPMFWSSGDSQDVTNFEVGKNREPIYAYFALETEELGHINLKKIAEDGQVANREFKITGEHLTQTIKTDESGFFTISNLKPGKYTITEINVPDQYLVPKSQTVQVKPNEITEVAFTNVLKKGYVNFLKKSTYEEIGLAGATYGIYKPLEQGEEDLLVASVTTGSDGHGVSDLLDYGSYYLKEIEAPDRYAKDDEKYEFFIEKNEETIFLEVTNEPLIGSLEYTYEEKEGGKTPETGDSNAFIPFALLILFGSSLFAVTEIKKMRLKKEKLENE